MALDVGPCSGTKTLNPFLSILNACDKAEIAKRCVGGIFERPENAFCISRKTTKSATETILEVRATACGVPLKTIHLEFQRPRAHLCCRHVSEAPVGKPCTCKVAQNSARFSLQRHEFELLAVLLCEASPTRTPKQHGNGPELRRRNDSRGATNPYHISSPRRCSYTPKGTRLALSSFASRLPARCAFMNNSISSISLCRPGGNS